MPETPYEHNRALLHAMVPSMRYDGREDFAAWQKRAGIKLAELLGLPFRKCEDCMTVESTCVRDEYEETRFRFQSEEGYFVPCHFLVPAGAAEPRPVAICLQGHSTGMHISLARPRYPGDEEKITGGDRGIAIQAVKEGYCALVLEQRCFGECGGTERGPDCHDSSLTALLIGRTTVGERVWDISRVIDVLEKHFSAQADLKKIICLGNSGGGTAAFYAACLEPRIRFAMPSCAVCTYEDSIAAMRHCECNYIPGLRKYFEMGDLAGLIAPRGLIVVSGKDDPIFPMSGVRKTVPVIQRLYAAAGAEDRFVFVVGNGGHRFYAADAWPALKTLLK